MNIYYVHVGIPTIYEIEAKDEQQAGRKARELYKKEYDTWIDPEVHSVHLSIADDEWLKPMLYKGRSPQAALIERIVSIVRTLEGLFR
jgi:hypothetical protein